ncbi:MAG: type II toxin-antitoxin system VapC family toxin [Mycobacteriales bacterium]
MTFVLDASVTMAWCFEDEASREADHALDLLATGDAVAPPLWTYEVANVLAVSEKRGRLTEADTARFLELLRQLPITVSAEPADPSTLVGLARRHQLTAYDSAYLALAEQEGLPLATVDTRLATAAKSAGVPLLGSTASE